MKRIFLLIVLVLAVAGGATFAMADSKGEDCHKRHSKMFEKKDANSDGVVSKAEFIAQAEKKFAKLDSNGNGEISEDEAKSYWEMKKGKDEKKSGQCNGK